MYGYGDFDGTGFQASGDELVGHTGASLPFGATLRGSPAGAGGGLCPLPADPEVVDRPLRRRFSPSYKLRIDPPEVRAPAERVVMADRHTVPPPPAYRWPSLPACGPRPVPQGGRVPDFAGAAYLADEPRPGGQRDPLIRRAPSGAQWPSRQGIHGPGATPGGRGPSCENTLGSEPVPSPRLGGSLPSTSVLPSAAPATGWRRTQLQATARDR